MKKLFLPLLTSSIVSAQVGFNTVTPNATVDVVGNSTNTTVIDGFIPPRLTGDQLKAKDNVYSSNQTAATVYVTAPVTSPSAKTANVNSIGYFYFDGTVWRPLTTPLSSGTLIGYSALVYGNNTAWPGDNAIQTLDISQGSGSLSAWRTDDTTITIPPNQAGTYIVSYTAGLLINGVVPSTYAFMAFPTKNGSQIGNRSNAAVAGGSFTNYSNETVANTWSTIESFVPGDQIQLKALTYGTSGTPTSFKVIRLSLEKIN